jgi:hypothetical protein
MDFMLEIPAEDRAQVTGRAAVEAASRISRKSPKEKEDPSFLKVR